MPDFRRPDSRSGGLRPGRAAHSGRHQPLELIGPGLAPTHRAVEDQSVDAGQQNGGPPPVPHPLPALRGTARFPVAEARLPPGAVRRPCLPGKNHGGDLTGN